MGSLQEYINNGGELPPGVRRTGDEPGTVHRPVGQQTLESHVIVPFLWSLLLALPVAGIVAGLAWRSGHKDALYPVLAFGLVFVLGYLARTKTSDRVLWHVEEFFGLDLDGDGHEGEPEAETFAPRAVPVHTARESREVPLPDRPVGLTRREWQQVAVACLNRGGNVSRRGIEANSNLSQMKSAHAAQLLTERGFAVNGRLAAAGWDWLLTMLPEHVACNMERPDDDEDDPPTPL